MLWKIIVAAVVAVILLIVLIVKLKKRQARIRAIRSKAEDKRREERLNQLILNPNARTGELQAQSEKPYAVHYGVADEGRAAKQKRWMLQIEEHSEISVRSFMLDPSNPITIGSGKENTVVLPGAMRPACACLKCTGTGSISPHARQRRRSRSPGERTGPGSADRSWRSAAAIS